LRAAFLPPVRTPPRHQSAAHADRRRGHHEEDAHVEVQNLHTLIERQAGERQYRGEDDDVRCEVVEELVRAPDRDDLLGEHFEYVGEDLESTPGPDAHGTQTALERSADLAFHEDHQDRHHYVHQQDAEPDDHAFDENRQSERHERSEQFMYPTCYYAEIKHIDLFYLIC